MRNSFENAKEANDITNLIMQDVDKYIKDNERTKESVQNENVEELITVLKSILEEKAYLRYYIEQYIKKMSSKELDSAEIDDTIKQGLDEVGFSIKKKNELLKKLTDPADNLKREDLCLYAIGLNISDKYLSVLMQNVLHQRGFNPRNYKEIIYRWCNSNYKKKIEGIEEKPKSIKKNIKEKADELINKYESEDFYISNDGSYDLMSGVTLVNPQINDLDFVEWLPVDTKVVSWSNNDAAQIKHEISAKGIIIDELNEILREWIDCQKTFSEKMNNSKCYKLSEALIAADIIYEDGAHDGLVDAYNTALLFAKMEREEELVLNPYYKRAIVNDDVECGFSLGSLFAGIDLSEFVMV